MFKGRIGLWVAIVVICLLFNWLTPIVPTWFESNDLNVKIDVETDNDMAQVLANKKINNIRIYVQNDDTDVIVTSDYVGNMENYTVYEDYLYSPLVMYVRNSIYSNSEGFINVPGTDYCYKVDLYSILVAMEQGKTWESLGFSKKVANGAVKLCIPNEQSSYYDEVVDLFYLTLNDGEVPSNKDMDELGPRVVALLEKCDKVTDIVQVVYDEYKNPSDTYKVLIGPEYLYRRGAGSSMSSSDNSSKTYRPVYFLHTVCLTANVCVKNGLDGENEVGSKFIEKMKSKYHFMYQTGWRVKNSTFDLDNLSYVYFETPSEFAATDPIPVWTEKLTNTDPLVNNTEKTIAPTTETIAEASADEMIRETTSPSETVAAEPVSAKTTIQEETEEETEEPIAVETVVQDSQGDDENESFTGSDIVFGIFGAILIFFFGALIVYWIFDL